MTGIPLLDELMADAWPPVLHVTRERWRYRWADGFTRRANSALAVGGGERMEELVDVAEMFYRERGAATVVQVSTASAPPELPSYLAARGYRRSARTLVLKADVGEVVHRASAHTHEVELLDAPSDEWFELYWTTQRRPGEDGSRAAVCRCVLLAPPRPTAFAVVPGGSCAAGTGQLVVDRGWGGVQCMVTAPAHRRSGIAAAILNQLAQAAGLRGASQLYLAVMADNRPARALYRRAGFSAAHEYSYFHLA